MTGLGDNFQWKDWRDNRVAVPEWRGMYPDLRWEVPKPPWRYRLGQWLIKLGTHVRGS